MNVAPLLVAVARRRPGGLGRFVALLGAFVFAVPLMLVLLVLALFAGSPTLDGHDRSGSVEACGPFGTGLRFRD